MFARILTRAALGLSAAALIASPAAATIEAGTVQLRGRVICICPDASSGEVHEVGVGSIADSGVDVDEAITLEFDVTVFLAQHIALEIIAATATHDISATGSLHAAGLRQIADTGVLPPTILIQGHFRPEKKFRPYIGGGINYTAFYSEDATKDLETALGGQTDVSLDDSWGWALQAGFDIALNDHWFFNFDLKYIDLGTTAHLSTDVAGPVNDEYEVDVDIDPWVPGFGFGYRFGSN